MEPEWAPPKTWKNIGNGTQAEVFTSNKHPTKAIKILFAYSGIEDAGYQFIRLCLNHQDNPHFPKIYNIKQYPEGPNEHRLLIVMEKLEKVKKSDIGLIEQLIGMKIANNSDIRNTSGELNEIFENPKLRKEIIQNTKYPSLKEALRLLEPMFRHYSPDMHLGNIMIRQSPNGPEVVFIDPLNIG